MNRSLQFTRPLPVDDTAMQKAVVKTFRDERFRRVRTVDDEFRDDVSTKLPCGEFSLSNVTTHKTWQEEYLDRFGKFIPLNSNWVCPHCHKVYLTGGYPPIRCVCGQTSPFGELVEANYFNR